MKQTSNNHRRVIARFFTLLSAALALTLLSGAMAGCITARAEGGAATALKTAYKIEITSESKASGWNSAVLELTYKYDGDYQGTEKWDIKDEMSKGSTVTKTFTYDDKIPFTLRLYLDFGGGFTIRSHKGHVKFYVEDELILNEAYSASSYPFNSSDETFEYALGGIVPTTLIDPKGNESVFPTVLSAWNKAANIDGCTLKLGGNAMVSDTLQVTKQVTVDLNGFFLSLAKEDSLFRVKPSGKLTLKDSDPDRDTGVTYICPDSPDQPFTLTGGGLYPCGPASKGGAINVEKGGELNVQQCTFTDCSATEDGGAICCEGKLSLDGTRFIYCTAGNRGGAVAVTGGTAPSVKNLIVDLCKAQSGGAFFIGNDAKSLKADVFDNCAFYKCSAIAGGALVVTGKTSFKATDLKCDECSADNGGGVYIYSTEPVEIDKAILSGCAAKTYGGGLYGMPGADLKLKEVTCMHCSSKNSGGGIGLLTDRVGGAVITLDNCELLTNTAQKQGGGLYICDNGGDTDETNKTVIRDSIIRTNVGGTGGGIYAESHFVYLIDSRIMQNEARGKHGGGVYVDSMRDIDVAGVVRIFDNTADGKKNNLCLQNGSFSSAKLYSGGLADGADIGISSTSGSAATVGKNLSQFQVDKFLHADEAGRGLSMTNTKEVATPLFASMISRNASVFIILFGVVIIAGTIGLLYYRKHRKGGRKNDGTTDEQSAKSAE